MARNRARLLLDLDAADGTRRRLVELDAALRLPLSRLVLILTVLSANACEQCRDGECAEKDVGSEDPDKQVTFHG